MKSIHCLRRPLAVLLTSVLVVGVGDTAAFREVATAAAPAAPNLAAPADGAEVTLPVAVAWSPVSGAGGYHWEVSHTADFASVIERNAVLLVGESTTQDAIGGLANGSYFWRVQAVSTDGEPGAWSSPRRFVVTGPGTSSPGTPTLNPPMNSTAFHSWENITFTWSAAAGAVAYVLQESTDPTFPVGTRVRQVNIPGTTERISFNPSLQGTFTARVIAVDANGRLGSPSNTVTFSVLDSNPFPAPPALLAPTNGTSRALPVQLSWTHVPNHQDLGYQVQVSSSSTFTSIEASYRVTENSKALAAVSAGTKFWRVRSQHGYIGSVEAFTAWSATGTFTVVASPLGVGALTFPATKYSGGEVRGTIELTGNAPAGGATVTLSTPTPNLLPELPASRVVPAGTSAIDILVAPTGFPNSLRGMRVGFVTTPTPVTLTATYAGTSVSTTFTILPPTLNDTPLQLFPMKATGGADMLGILDLEVGCFAGFCDGLAPPGGFEVALSSSSPAAVVPASVTIPAGAGGTQFPIATSPVASVTTVTITASAGNVTTHWQITLTPPPPPASLVLDPVETAGGSRGIVRIPLAALKGHDQILQLTSSNPQVAAVPSTVTIPASTESGVFFITTGAVSTRTAVTITVNGAGVTRAVELVVHPSLPALTGFTISPTTVTGGNPATGTVTLGTPAPSGGLAVSLSSSLPGAVSVPPSVTVPAGALSATFTATTFPVDNTTAQLTATLGSTTLFASLGVTRASSPVTVSALSLNPTSVVGGTTSTATVTLSASAPSGGAVVSLSDDAAAVSVPASVTVSAGSRTRTFTVTTSAVPSQSVATISASFGGSTRTAALTITPLAAPTLQLPANASNGVAQPVAFDWSNVANAVDYEIQVDDSSTFAAPFVATRTTATSDASITGLPTAQLWWRVRARNAAGVFGPFSSTFRFTPTGSGSPPTLVAPTLSAPSNDARFDEGRNIVFDWSDVSGAARYIVQIDDQSTFGSPNVDASVTPSTYSTSTLTARRYWWRVRAVDAAGVLGPWSSVRRIEVRD